MRLGGEVGPLPDHIPVDCVQSQVVDSKALQTLRPACQDPPAGPAGREFVWPGRRPWLPETQASRALRVSLAK